MESWPSASKRLARGGKARLRLIAEREQRFLAARRGAPAGDVEHGLARQVGGLAGLRRFGERAVAADVAAQVRQRDEHFARIRDVAAVSGEAELLGGRR